MTRDQAVTWLASATIAVVFGAFLWAIMEAPAWAAWGLGLMTFWMLMGFGKR